MNTIQSGWKGFENAVVPKNAPMVQRKEMIKRLAMISNLAIKQTHEAAIELAFEAGKWVGQVELEEHFDREQYSQAMLECFYSRKHAMPMHDAAHGARKVEVFLRSQTWRDGVRKSSDEYKQKAIKLLKNGSLRNDDFTG